MLFLFSTAKIIKFEYESQNCIFELFCATCVDKITLLVDYVSKSLPGQSSNSVCELKFINENRK